jgi:hypothetical protein
MEKAACSGVMREPRTEGEKNPFFPVRGQTTRQAKESFCGQCPVTEECDSYADRIGANHGVWGGRYRGRGTG